MIVDDIVYHSINIRISPELDIIGYEDLVDIKIVGVEIQIMERVSEILGLGIYLSKISIDTTPFYTS